MGTILHLSDLHLGEADVWERKTDDKAGLVPPDENTRLSVIKTSLKAVKRYLDKMGLELDALLVSGDITSQHDTSGFRRFGTLLDEVALAPLDRIVAVPGNHDVDWQKEPGTAEKYAAFLQHTRAQGMRTPLCDGVDFTGDPADCEADPVLVLDDCVLVAVNSANWCGVKLGTPRRSRHVYDVARVSEAQLDRLTDTLRAHDTSELVRMAILHHHLLPVTEDEEVKHFESFNRSGRRRAHPGAPHTTGRAGPHPAVRSASRKRR
jgi:3',5'-cyclic AMP phosphodiesterase CpdA